MGLFFILQPHLLKNFDHTSEKDVLTMNEKQLNLASHFVTGKLEACIDTINCTERKEVHSHYQYILYAIETGRGKHNIDFTDLEIRPGRVFFITPGQMHCFSSDSVSGYFLIFDLDFYHCVKSVFKLYDFPFFHTSLTLPYLDCGDGFPEILMGLERMYREYVSSETFGKLSILRSELENLLIQFTRIKQSQSGDDKQILVPNNEKVRKLELLIEQNFKEHKEVDFYAGELHISSRHLNNIIFEKTGKSISLMIHDRILIEAKRQLLHSEKTVAEIAYELGFGDKAYFHRYFKKLTGKTPLGFRNEFVAGR